MVALVKKLVLVIVLCALVLFAYQNAGLLSQTLQFRLDAYAWNWKTPEFPLVFLLVVCFLLGMLLAGFHGLYERLARRADIRKRDKRIRALEKELAELRAQHRETASSPSADGRSLQRISEPSSSPEDKRPRAEPSSPQTEEEPSL